MIAEKKFLDVCQQARSLAYRARTFAPSLRWELSKEAEHLVWMHIVPFPHYSGDMNYVTCNSKGEAEQWLGIDIKESEYVGAHLAELSSIDASFVAFITHEGKLIEASKRSGAGARTFPMHPDSEAISPVADFETLTLEQKTIWLGQAITREALEYFANEPKIAWEHRAHDFVMKMRLEVYGQTIKDLNIVVPSTWWDALLDRWCKGGELFARKQRLIPRRFKRWLIAKLTIHYTRYTMKVDALYPMIAHPRGQRGYLHMPINQTVKFIRGE